MFTMNSNWKCERRKFDKRSKNIHTSIYFNTLNMSSKSRYYVGFDSYGDCYTIGKQYAVDDVINGENISQAFSGMKNTTLTGSTNKFYCSRVIVI